MHLSFVAMLVELSRTAAAMCVAAGVLFLSATWSSRDEITHLHGLDKVLAFRNLCFAVPLAIFGALHLYGPQFVAALVPRYMHWRMFWVYFVGCALLAAALSFATRIAVRWSGLLFGIMMFSFVAMLYLPSALRHLPQLRDFAEYTRRGYRLTWVIVFRESSFGGAAWLLSALAAPRWPRTLSRTMIMVGRVCITMALIFFGVQHFLHPQGLPGVPLQKQMPAWLHGRAIIDYLTGVALLVLAASVLLRWKTRIIAVSVGAWILLLVVVMYVPVMLAALSSPDIGVQVEGINYFADTLLFAGVILALAASMPQSNVLDRATAPGSALS
jgi:uncharacterized membrane protein